MTDWMDPDAVMATNPYLRPLDKWTVLGNLPMGAGMAGSMCRSTRVLNHPIHA